MTIVDTIAMKKFPDETGKYEVSCSIKEILFNGSQITGLLMFEKDAKVKGETMAWFMDNMKWVHMLEAVPIDENIREIVFADFEMTNDDARKIANIMRDNIPFHPKIECENRLLSQGKWSHRYD
jgi:hypothetical protein